MKTSHLPDSIGNTTISRLFSFHTTHLFPFFFFFPSFLFFFFTVRCANCASVHVCFSVLPSFLPTAARLHACFSHGFAKPDNFLPPTVRALFSPSPLSCFVLPPLSLFSLSSFHFFPSQFNRRTLPIPASTRYIIRYSGREPGRPIAAPSDPFAPLFLWVGDDETLLNIYTFSLTFYLDIKRDEY